MLKMNKPRQREVDITAKSIGISVLVLIALVTTVLGNLIEIEASKYVLLMVAIGLSLVVYPQTKRETRKKFFLTLYFSVFLWIVFSLLVVYREPFFYKPFAITNLISIYLGVLIGFIFVYFRVNVSYIKTLYYIVTFFFIVSFVLFGMSFYVLTGKASGAPLGLALMSLIIPIIYLEYRDSHKISFLPLVLQVMVLLFVSSRISLGYSLLLLVSSLFVIVKSSAKNFLVRVVEYSLLGLMLFFVIYLVSSNSSLDVITKFQDMSTDTHGREDIWELYFNNFTIRDFFYGKNVVVPFYDWDNFPNPHNSWIQLHSLLGFVGVLFMSFLIWMLFVFLRKNIYYSLVIVSLILLGFFNTIFFFYPTDWALYIFIFEYFRIKREKPYNFKVILKMI